MPMPVNPRLNPAKDAKRPLDKLGIEQSHDVGRALAALDITVDVIISSPLRRATQTAAVVANEIDHEDKVVIDNALSPGRDLRAIPGVAGAATAARTPIMVVGHNPSMTEFLNKLVGDRRHAALEMKKGRHRAGGKR